MTNKDKILQVALELFADQGYDRTPTSLIAKQSGISEGLIFRHFGSKAGLLSAIIRMGLEQIAETMEAYSDMGMDPGQAILKHIEQSLSTIRTHEKFWQLVTRIRFQVAVHDAMGDQIAQVNAYVVQRLTSHFIRLKAAQPKEEALLLFALIDGICLHWLRAPDEYPLDLMKELLLNKYRYVKY
jgi:AcrR family transcriptional regulator